MNIKAIETRYKGYRFRSRLEARWAVFFDAMGYAWEYEPEGYELGVLGRYLPDFRVWRQGAINGSATVGLGSPHWIEVKGAEPSLREKELITELFWTTRTAAAIVYGNIECKYSSYDRSWGVPAYIPFFGAMPDSWGAIAPYMVDGSDGSDHGPALLQVRGTRAPEAVAAARSARFEHGQSGAA